LCYKLHNSPYLECTRRFVDGASHVAPIVSCLPLGTGAHLLIREG